MSKVTGKFQITLPKRVVEAHGIKVGDDLEIVSEATHIALLPANRQKVGVGEPAERLGYFDRATERQKKRERSCGLAPGKSRGWSREELYSRGRSS
ncbi:MAG: AbrB/MazE/SpoVT family DNA-binding domain-containing protein [Steroidobacteraceae bacterium]|jgi:AbrB family looped-hinge helix DNA binding protein